MHNSKWAVYIHPKLENELAKRRPALVTELFSRLRLLEQFGQELGRPHVDTLHGSEFSNMKELRFSWRRGIYRYAFAFDKARSAILLVGGDKRGANSKRFYRSLIRVADRRYKEHLKS